MALIISGHPRSGTTLLRDLCNGHPDITITNEFANFTNLDTSYIRYSGRLLKRCWREKNRSFLITGSEKRQSEFLLKSYVFIGRYLFELNRHRSGPIDISAVETALRCCFPANRIVGDKYPRYESMLDKLACIDGLVHLVIYRDCRDVTRSVLERVRTKWRNKAFIKNINTVEKIARRWVGAIERMERYADRIHIIRYENLIREPGGELEIVGQLLGVDPGGFPIDMIYNTSIGRYKQGLSEDQLTSVMKIAGPTMTRLGYL